VNFRELIEDVLTHLIHHITLYKTLHTTFTKVSYPVNLSKINIGIGRTPPLDISIKFNNFTGGNDDEYAAKYNFS
jgi:hypothetical protein